MLFLLGCAVAFYGIAPDLPTSASNRPTSSPTASSPAENPPNATSPTDSTPTAGPSSSEASQATDPEQTTSAATPADSPSSSAERAIQLEGSAYSGKPFQTLPVRGTYRGGANTMLELQRLEGGTWVSNPLPTKTDGKGRFTTYVELGPGLHWLRILDPSSGLTSEIFAVVIKP